MDGFQVVSKEDFEAIEDTNAKLNILYGYIVDLGLSLKKTNAEVDSIKRQAKWYKAISAMAGFVGGLVGGFAKTIGIR